MKYTQKWVWQKQDEVYTNSYTGKLLEGPHKGFCARETTSLRYGPSWLRDYRDKLRAIQTQEQASQAIRQYWHNVAKEWNNGKGIRH